MIVLVYPFYNCIIEVLLFFFCFFFSFFLFCIYYTAHSGNSSKPNTTVPNVGNNANNTNIAMIDTPTPALTISLVGKLHGAAAIAFGGVPTGKQKACEQANAAGIIRYNGCHLAAIDISANTGNNTLATATLLENSVNVDAIKHAIANTANFGNCTSAPKFLAINSLIPVTFEPSANAKPPPNRNIRPHGNFCWTTFHVINACDGCFGLFSSSLLNM